MHPLIKVLTLSIGTLLAAGLSVATHAQETAAHPDQGVVSGLGIRNIGSATMSGRISALTAVAKTAA